MREAPPTGEGGVTVREAPPTGLPLLRCPGKSAFKTGAKNPNTLENLQYSKKDEMVFI